MPFPSYSRGRIVRRSQQHVRGRGGGAPRPPPPKSFLPPLADELWQGAAVAEPQSAAPMPPSSSSGTQSLSTRRPSARALRRSSYRLHAAGERSSTDEASSTDDEQGLRLHPSSPDDDFEALLPAAHVSPVSVSVSLTPPAAITQPPSSLEQATTSSERPNSDLAPAAPPVPAPTSSSDSSRFGENFWYRDDAGRYHLRYPQEAAGVPAELHHEVWSHLTKGQRRHWLHSVRSLQGRAAAAPGTANDEATAGAAALPPEQAVAAETTPHPATVDRRHFAELPARAELRTEQRTVPPSEDSMDPPGRISQRA